MPDPIQDFSKLPPLVEGLGQAVTREAPPPAANSRGKDEAIEARLQILLSLLEERMKALEIRNNDVPPLRAVPVRLGAGTVITLAGTFLAMAALVALTSFGLMIQLDRTEDRIGRIDERYTEKLAALERRVTELPNSMMQGMLDLNRTITDAITAAKQPPQVVVLPPAEQAPRTPARAPAPPAPQPRP